MIELLQLFANNLLPIFLCAGTGYLLASWLKVPARPISQSAFYIFSPCLIFNLMTKSALKGREIGLMVSITILSCLIMGGLTWVIGTLFRQPRKIKAAMMLTSMLVNAGNYGLAVVLFAFGQQALAYASLFFVTNALLAYSLGALIASLGSASLVQSLKNLLKVPAMYAMLLGIIMLATGWKLPIPVDRAVSLLSDASIPVLMVVLGMQLQGVKWRGNKLPLSLATGLRLLIAPLIAWALSILLNLKGPARLSAILEASMPSAILTIVIATEYNLQPSFVTAVVFLTTILSPLTLTPLLKFLGG